MNMYILNLTIYVHKKMVIYKKLHKYNKNLLFEIFHLTIFNICLQDLVNNDLI